MEYFILKYIFIYRFVLHFVCYLRVLHKGCFKVLSVLKAIFVFNKLTTLITLLRFVLREARIHFHWFILFLKTIDFFLK